MSEREIENEMVKALCFCRYPEKRKANDILQLSISQALT